MEETKFGATFIQYSTVVTTKYLIMWKTRYKYKETSAFVAIYRDIRMRAAYPCLRYIISSKGT